ncbi:site-2 protease family protein [Sphingomonas sp. NIBR02145]|uniref:site-2 protease family protein n=1 Tax=Sphingomonas sp. NIBR02145 TaxID=3014784 RepID=UPI0022B4A4F1|nr:site-2 protease family protein [Sphingomonas sp. NIBR02145]WHU04008.1 site-2 protease family protein [Sphingomonas sp. NIBR02145]
MRALAIVIFFLTAFGVMGVLSEHFRGDAGLPARLIVDALLCLIAVLVHELGHAAAAHRLGADIRSIVVLPFEYSMRQRRLRLKWRAGMGDLGGYVSYVLDRIDARRKHMMIAAAGPIANLLLALLAGTGATLIGSATLAGALLGALALLSAGMGIANLVPFRGSDGHHILQGLRAGARNKSVR